MRRYTVRYGGGWRLGRDTVRYRGWVGIGERYCSVRYGGQEGIGER